MVQMTVTSYIAKHAKAALLAHKKDTAGPARDANAMSETLHSHAMTVATAGKQQQKELNHTGPSRKSKLRLSSGRHDMCFTSTTRSQYRKANGDCRNVSSRMQAAWPS